MNCLKGLLPLRQHYEQLQEASFSEAENACTGHNKVVEHPHINQRQRLHYLPPSADRWKERSRTFSGLADAMANQWTLATLPNDRS